MRITYAVRSKSWSSSPPFTRTTDRHWSFVDNHNIDLGFRVIEKEDKSIDMDMLYLVRGGSWINLLAWARSTFREWDKPENHFSNFGFRIIKGS